MGPDCMTSTPPEQGVRRPASMKDVAARAGVSVKTVSNVINGAQVAPATRERVEGAIAELGYRPKSARRNLRRGRTGILALALSEIDVPYFAELARLIVDTAEGHGYTILIDQTNGDAKREQYVVDGMAAQLVDGIIFSPVAMDRLDIARAYRHHAARPARRARLGRPRTTSRSTTSPRRVRRPSTSLLSAAAASPRSAPSPPTSRAPRGCARPGTARRCATPGSRSRRRSSCTARQYHRRDGAEAAAYLAELEEPPDAVFCFNDTLALGAMRTFYDRGYRVPEDVAVVGFDDIDDGRYNVPSLTTISPDKAGIARSALRLLLDRIERGRLTAPRGDGQPRAARPREHRPRRTRPYAPAPRPGARTPTGGCRRGAGSAGRSRWP